MNFGVELLFDGVAAGAAAGINTMGIGFSMRMMSKSTKYLTEERGDMLF